MKKALLFEIAKIIDSEFIGSDKSFSADRYGGIGYWLLATNRCDHASMIRVYGRGDEISHITRIGEDTDTWQAIHPNTVKRVNELLSQRNIGQIKV